MKQKVCVVGLGYVGLPLLIQIAEKGYESTGFDINEGMIADLKKGKVHFKDEHVESKLNKLSTKPVFTTDSKVLKDNDIVIVCVPTPVDDNHKPNLGALKNACQNITENMKKGQLILIESTVFPGTVEEIILPILEKSKLKVGKDFFLAHCPERIDPGNLMYDVSNISRVVGGVTKKCGEKALEFYLELIDSSVTMLNSVKSAEASKMVENIFRDVNIALVNELAMSFDTIGIDTVEVIKAAATKPFAFMPHYPGCGVGGHCIPVDPYYLIERARQNGFEHEFLSLARSINKSMPSYTVSKASEALKETGKELKGAKVLVLGLAYKGNVDDLRESPAFDVIKKLDEAGAVLDVYDPFALKESTVKDLDSGLTKKDCVVLVTDHADFRLINGKKLKEFGIKAMVDGRNFLDRESFLESGIVYKGIGR